MPQDARDLAAAYLEGDVTVRIGTAETPGFTNHEDVPVFDQDTGISRTERRRSFLVPAGVFAADSLVFNAVVEVTDRQSDAVTSWKLLDHFEVPPDGAELRLVVK